MHGLKPEDLNHLLPMCGRSLIQICVGQNEVIFNLHPEGGITVVGRCELLDRDGAILDSWEHDAKFSTYRFFELLGQDIDEVRIDSSKSFVATFASGLKLRVIDNSDQYESFAFGGLFV